MARNISPQQARSEAQGGTQQPAPGHAPQSGGSPGLPQREAPQGAFPAPRAVMAAPHSEGPPSRRYKVKPNAGAMGDPQLKGGYRIMQPSTGAPGAPSYTAILPAGRVVTDASHDIGRLIAQGVELDEILPPASLGVKPTAPEEPEADLKATA